MAGGIAAGEHDRVRHANTGQASAPPAPKPVVPGPAPKQKGHKKVSKTPTAPEQKRSRRSAPLLAPPVGLQPQLTAGGYVFPVYGPANYGDTYGAFRGDVAGNWHHGDDIFAALGAPILACADGIVFSVGWNDVGGNRLWLRDQEGNEFYYAHLSAYTPLAVEGRRVEAGDVIGFVGDTGDADGGSPHLHFEIRQPAAPGSYTGTPINPYESLRQATVWSTVSRWEGSCNSVFRFRLIKVSSARAAYGFILGRSSLMSRCSTSAAWQTGSAEPSFRQSTQF